MPLNKVTKLNTPYMLFDFWLEIFQFKKKGNFRGIMAKMLVSGLNVNEFTFGLIPLGNV